MVWGLAVGGFMAKMAKIAKIDQQMAVNSKFQKKILAYINYVNLFCGKEAETKA